MFTMIAAAALAAAQTPAAPATDHSQHRQASQLEHSSMKHGTADHSKTDQDGCCKKTADGKMECAMSNKTGAAAHKGHGAH